MGNVLQTQRLVRAVTDESTSSNISSVLQLVQQRPALLTAKSAAVGGTIWHWAAEKGNVLLLEELIRFINRTTAAAATETRQELRQHLNQGFDLDTTPLMLACKHGQAEAAQTLLQHGADPQLVDRRGNNTCLHIAAFAGRANVIKVILDTAVSYPLLMETNQTLEFPQQQQQQAHPPPQQRRPVQHMQDAASLLNTGNIDGLTALHLAVCRGHAEVVRALLEAGASLSSSSRFPTHVGHLYLPSRTTPLHAAVHARNMQCIVLLLTAHEQRYGGTAAARAQDPRLLLNGNGQMPYHMARRLRLSDSVCEMLYPLSPLREHLQQQQQQQQQLCHSLQVLAGAALKDALLSQLHCVAAAVGAGDTGQQQQQQQSEVATSTTAGNTAAAAAEHELSHMLQDSVMVCVSITHSESLCVKLGSRHSSQLLPPQAAAAVVAAADWQNLLDAVRFHILCHGVCDPQDPGSCWFADACDTCTAMACNKPGNSSSSSSHGPGNAALCVGTHRSDPITAQDCCPAATGPNSGACTGSSSSSSNAVGVADCYRGSLGDLHCNVMPAAKCSQVPGAALLGHSKLLPLLRGIKSGCAAGWSVLQGGGSWREACGVCFEEEQGLLLQLRPCKHVLCLSCVQLLVGMIGSKPALCPFCRAAMAGVQVHVGNTQL